MADRKILPKTQAQLSQATITPYDKLNKGKEPLQTPKKRGERRSVKNDDVKQFQITKYGMKDFNASDFIVKKGNSFLGVSLKNAASHCLQPQVLSIGKSGIQPTK